MYGTDTNVCKCSVNMESEKWTHILNLIAVQLKGDLNGILASKCVITYSKNLRITSNSRE